MQFLNNLALGIACVGLFVPSPSLLHAESTEDTVLVRGDDPRDPESTVPDDVRNAYLTSLSRFPNISDCIDATDEVRVRWEDMISSTDIEVCFAWIALEAGNQDEYMRSLEDLGGNVFIMQRNWSSMRMHGSGGDGFIISTGWSMREGEVAVSLSRDLEGNQDVSLAVGMTINTYVDMDFSILSTQVGFTIN